MKYALIILLLVGCESKDTRPKKCIDNKQYHNNGYMWVESYGEQPCKPLEEEK